MPEAGSASKNNSIIPNPGSSLKEKFFFLVVILIVLPVLFTPLSNPDLFWDFSAAHWMLVHHAFPRIDFLSFTKAGAPWIDFEWLSQIIFFFVYRHGGFLSLLILKALLLLLCWEPISWSLKNLRLSKSEMSATFLFWATTSLAHSDLRPELFSLFFFALVIYLLEKRRAQAQSFSWKSLLGISLLFALWANLHAGFIFGEMLFVFYAFLELLTGNESGFREITLMGALSAMATLVNPYGFGPYQIAFSHLRESRPLSLSINEWESFNFAPLIHWPIDIALAALLCLTCAIVISPRMRAKNKENLPLIALAIFLGILTLFYRRFSPYFIIAFIISGAKFLKQMRPQHTTSFFLTGLCAFYIFLFASQTDWKAPLSGRLVPEKAAAFLKEERPVISNLRVYNEWEWGGYLGWTLRPWFKVYCDGRYLFHDLLFHLSTAVQSPGSWQKFLDAQDIDAALMPNLNRQISTTRIYPDQTARHFQRPWYLSFMPRKQWALVYWDEKTLFFIKRKAVPQAWLGQHEYRLWHPHDMLALKDALKRGEVSAALLKKEQARHLREISLAPTHGWGLSGF